MRLDHLDKSIQPLASGQSQRLHESVHTIARAVLPLVGHVCSGATMTSKSYGCQNT